MSCFDRDRFKGWRTGEFCELDFDADPANAEPRGDHTDLGWGDQSGCVNGLPKDPADEAVWFFPPYTSYGDYSDTTLVEKSNYRVLLAECISSDKDEDEVPDDCRPFFVTLSGGHDSNAIALHIERTPDRIIDIIEKLENYPVLDEDDLSELELEGEVEAWENWVKGDYRSDLETKMSEALEEFAEKHGLDIDTDVDLSDVEDDALRDHFWHWSNEANQYFENDGMNRYIRVEPIAEAAAEALFTDPEAIPRGWELPEGFPSGSVPVFTDPRQMLLPFKEGFPERYTPPPETRAPLTQQEAALIEEMVRLGWYRRDDREGQIAHILRMREAAVGRAARGGMNGLGGLNVRGMSAGELCVLVRRAPQRTRNRLLDLPSWNRKLGSRR